MFFNTDAANAYYLRTNSKPVYDVAEDLYAASPPGRREGLSSFTPHDLSVDRYQRNGDPVFSAQERTAYTTAHNDAEHGNGEDRAYALQYPPPARPLGSAAPRRPPPVATTTTTTTTTAGSSLSVGNGVDLLYQARTRGGGAPAGPGSAIWAQASYLPRASRPSSANPTLAGHRLPSSSAGGSMNGSGGVRAGHTHGPSTRPGRLSPTSGHVVASLASASGSGHPQRPSSAPALRTPAGAATATTSTGGFLPVASRPTLYTSFNQNLRSTGPLAPSPHHPQQQPCGENRRAPAPPSGYTAGRRASDGRAGVRQGGIEAPSQSFLPAPTANTRSRRSLEPREGYPASVLNIMPDDDEGANVSALSSLSPSKPGGVLTGDAAISCSTHLSGTSTVEERPLHPSGNAHEAMEYWAEVAQGQRTRNNAIDSYASAAGVPAASPDREEDGAEGEEDQEAEAAAAAAAETSERGDDSTRVVWWTVDVVLTFLTGRYASFAEEAAAMLAAATTQSPADLRVVCSVQCRAPILPSNISREEAWEMTHSFLRCVALSSVAGTSVAGIPSVPQAFYYFDTDFNQYVQLNAETLPLASPLVRVVMVASSTESIVASDSLAERREWEARTIVESPSRQTYSRPQSAPRAVLSTTPSRQLQYPPPQQWSESRETLRSTSREPNGPPRHHRPPFDNDIDANSPLPTPQLSQQQQTGVYYDYDDAAAESDHTYPMDGYYEEEEAYGGAEARGHGEYDAHPHEEAYEHYTHHPAEMWVSADELNGDEYDAEAAYVAEQQLHATSAAGGRLPRSRYVPAAPQERRSSASHRVAAPVSRATAPRPPPATMTSMSAYSSTSWEATNGRSDTSISAIRPTPPVVPPYPHPPLRHAAQQPPKRPAPQYFDDPILQRSSASSVQPPLFSSSFSHTSLTDSLAGRITFQASTLTPTPPRSSPPPHLVYRPATHPYFGESCSTPPSQQQQRQGASGFTAFANASQPQRYAGASLSSSSPSHQDALNALLRRSAEAMKSKSHNAFLSANQDTQMHEEEKARKEPALAHPLAAQLKASFMPCRSPPPPHPLPEQSEVPANEGVGETAYSAVDEVEQLASLAEDTAAMEAAMAMALTTAQHAATEAIRVQRSKRVVPLQLPIHHDEEEEEKAIAPADSTTAQHASSLPAEIAQRGHLNHSGIVHDAPESKQASEEEEIVVKAPTSGVSKRPADVFAADVAGERSSTYAISIDANSSNKDEHAPALVNSSEVSEENPHSIEREATCVPANEERVLKGSEEGLAQMEEAEEEAQVDADLDLMLESRANPNYMSNTTVDAGRMNPAEALASEHGSKDESHPAVADDVAGDVAAASPPPIVANAEKELEAEAEAAGDSDEEKKSTNASAASEGHDEDQVDKEDREATDPVADDGAVPIEPAAVAVTAFRDTVIAQEEHAVANSVDDVAAPELAEEEARAPEALTGKDAVTSLPNTPPVESEGEVGDEKEEAALPPATTPDKDNADVTDTAGIPPPEPHSDMEESGEEKEEEEQESNASPSSQLDKEKADDVPPVADQAASEADVDGHTPEPNVGAAPSPNDDAEKEADRTSPKPDSGEDVIEQTDTVVAVDTSNAEHLEEKEDAESSADAHSQASALARSSTSARCASAAQEPPADELTIHEKEAHSEENQSVADEEELAEADREGKAVAVDTNDSAEQSFPPLQADEEEVPADVPVEAADVDAASTTADGAAEAPEASAVEPAVLADSTSQTQLKEEAEEEAKAVEALTDHLATSMHETESVAGGEDKEGDGEALGLSAESADDLAQQEAAPAVEEEEEHSAGEHAGEEAGRPSASDVDGEKRAAEDEEEESGQIDHESATLPDSARVESEAADRNQFMIDIAMERSSMNNSDAAAAATAASPASSSVAGDDNTDHADETKPEEAADTGADVASEHSEDTPAEVVVVVVAPVAEEGVIGIGNEAASAAAPLPEVSTPFPTTLVGNLHDEPERESEEREERTSVLGTTSSSHCEDTPADTALPADTQEVASASNGEKQPCAEHSHHASEEEEEDASVREREASEAEETPASPCSPGDGAPLSTAEESPVSAVDESDPNGDDEDCSAKAETSTQRPTAGADSASHTPSEPPPHGEEPELTVDGATANVSEGDTAAPEPEVSFTKDEGDFIDTVHAERPRVEAQRSADDREENAAVTDADAPPRRDAQKEGEGEEPQDADVMEHLSKDGAAQQAEVDREDESPTADAALKQPAVPAAPAAEKEKDDTSNTAHSVTDFGCGALGGSHRSAPLKLSHMDYYSGMTDLSADPAEQLTQLKEDLDAPPMFHRSIAGMVGVGPTPAALAAATTTTTGMGGSGAGVPVWATEDEPHRVPDIARVATDDEAEEISHLNTTTTTHGNDIEEGMTDAPMNAFRDSMSITHTPTLTRREEEEGPEDTSVVGTTSLGEAGDMLVHIGCSYSSVPSEKIGATMGSKAKSEVADAPPCTVAPPAEDAPTTTCVGALAVPAKPSSSASAPEVESFTRAVMETTSNEPRDGISLSTATQADGSMGSLSPTPTPVTATLGSGQTFPRENNIYPATPAATATCSMGEMSDERATTAPVTVTTMQQQQQQYVPPPSQPQPADTDAPSYLDAEAQLPAISCNENAMRKTMVLLGFPGSAWEYIMTHHYEPMHEAFITDAADAADVPQSSIQDVRYSRGSLMVDLYVLHSARVEEQEMRDQMCNYAYPLLWALYEEKKRERKKLLHGEGSGSGGGSGGGGGGGILRGMRQTTLSAQEEVKWTPSS